jgi:hypothetical protein
MRDSSKASCEARVTYHEQANLTSDERERASTDPLRAIFSAVEPRANFPSAVSVGAFEFNTPLDMDSSGSGAS